MQAAPDFPGRLVEGYAAFRGGRYNQEHARFRALAEKGQTPEIMIIGCCDSRVSPEVIFDAGPGEIFVVRNVANLVPPYRPDGDLHGTSAALEFAVVGLKVRHIVVMGHGRCGGIHAALHGSAPLSSGDFIGHWMSIVGDVAERVRADETLDDTKRQTTLEHEAVRHSIDNLMQFPDVRAGVESGTLAVHGAWFDVAEGALHVLDRASGRFVVAAS